MAPARGVPINGAAVRALREARGVNLSSFAIDTLISTGYLSNIEAGRKVMVSPEVRERIAKRLQLEGIDAIAYVGASDQQVSA